MRLNREATPFETLGHIAGVHYVAMTVAQGLYAAGVPIDLTLTSGAAAGHDLDKFGCKPNERVPYLHYYYTNQWFTAYHMEGIGHIAANHSTWDLELDNISVESLVLIYADFRVKQMRGEDGRELTKIYTLKDSFDVILSSSTTWMKRNGTATVSFIPVCTNLSATCVQKAWMWTSQAIRTRQKSRWTSSCSPENRWCARLYSGDRAQHRRHAPARHRAPVRKHSRGGAGERLEECRAYLNMFNEYSIHLNHRQKEQTISFLYELLLNRGRHPQAGGGPGRKNVRGLQRRIPERTSEKHAGSG